MGALLKTVCLTFFGQLPNTLEAEEIYFLDYIKACIDLAHEYVKLGRTEKAGGLYNHAVGLVNQPTAGDQLRILFFLRYTESLALTGNVRQRYFISRFGVKSYLICSRYFSPQL